MGRSSNKQFQDRYSFSEDKLPICSVRNRKDDIICGMNRPVRIMSTGGTIDSSIEYDPTKKSVFKGTNLPSVLKQARLRCRIELEPLMQKDSDDVTDEDRTMILEHCRACRERNIVVTHGTDTMAKTARFLGEGQIDNKTVVLVGSFVPLSQDHSDALFNLGYAIATAQCLPCGVWVAMGGEVFSWDNVKKNKDDQTFERVQ